MIRSTLTAVPRRLPALWAKALVLTVVTAVTVAVGDASSSWLVALPTLHAHDAVLDLGDPQTRRILLGGVLYLVAVALLAFAIGAIVRVSAGALATVLGLLLVVEVLFRTIPADFFRTVSPFLPGPPAISSSPPRPASRRPGWRRAHRCSTRGPATA